MKTLIAKANAGDIIWFLAAINRIAEILAAQGDTNPIGARRARAVGILARPAEALDLLIQHQHDPDPTTPNRASQANEPAESRESSEASEPAESPESSEAGETRESGEPSESDAGEPVNVDAIPAPESQGDGEPEPAPEPDDEPEPAPEVDDHQSLSMRLPPAFNAKAARPRVVLHFHLSEAALRAGHAVVRPADGSPITLDQLIEFLAGSGCQIHIQPVFDPTEIAPVDGYEIPARLRAAVRVRQVADVFPFGTCLSSQMDLDHTERYISMDYGGPPGQTRLGNLGPFARPGHRAVTHGGWQKHQPEPGYYVFRSPTGYIYLVTNQGTLALGRTPFSAAVWEASTPKPAAA